MSGGSEQKEPALFTRSASGLVRNVRPVTAAIMNLMWTQVAMGFVLASLTIGLYPGANVPLTYILIAGVSCIIGFLYLMFSAAMPRTGGDYIYVSRALSPALGFISNFMFNVNINGWIATWTAAAVPAGLCAFFAALSIETGNQQFADAALWLINPVPYFLITTLMNIGSGLIVYYGTKWVGRFCWAFFICSIIGVATYVIFMATTGPEVFKAGWNQLSGTTYDAVIAAAERAGYFLGISLTGTLFGFVYAYQNTIGYTVSVYYAGEIKSTNMVKAQAVAIFLSIALFTTITASIGFATYAGLGQTFFHAISQLFWVGGGESIIPPIVATLGVPSTVFLGYMGAPIWVLALILLAGIFGPWGLSLPMVFTNSRCAFAWGFDRIYPSKFADISRKHGAPTLAIWYNVAVSAVITYLYVFFPAQFGAMTYTMMLWAAGEIIVAFAGIVFPFKRKDIFAAAPSVVRMKIGAIPLMSIVAAICLGFLVFIEYAIVTPLFEGLIDYTGAVGITVIFVGTPTIIYFVSRWYQRRKGVPIDLAHRALPPE